MSSVLNFGKHTGKTLVEIVLSDWAWFAWALDNKIFQQRSDRLQAEAAEVWAKARNIKIPRSYAHGSRAAYYFEARTGKFMDLMIVPDGGRYEEDADIRDVLDVAYVGRSKKKDMVGKKRAATALKRILFGKGVRPDRDTLERFFANPENFDLPDLAQAAE